MIRRPVYYIDRGDTAGLMAALDKRPQDIDFVDADGQSLLHAAAIKTVPIEITEILIRRGIDVNRQDSEGATALAYAVVWNRADVAESIINAGGRLDIADVHGNQPLWYAVGNPRADSKLIELLVRRGANPHHRNRYAKSPFDFAREVNEEPIIRALSGETTE